MKTRLLMMVMSSLLLSSCALASPPVPNGKEPIVADGNSQFTPAGIAGISNAHKTVFDFTARPLKMSGLGLGQDSDGALVAPASDQPIAVSMTTPSGVVEMETDAIRIRRGTDNAVDHIDFFVTRPDVPGANEELRKAADELGFALIRKAAPFGAASRESPRREKWYPGYGNLTGTVYSVEIYSDPDTGRTTFIYSVHVADKFYSAEATEKIEATGKP